MATFRDFIPPILIRAAYKACVSIAEFPAYFASAGDEIDCDSRSGVKTDKPYAQSGWVYSAVTLIARNVARTPFRHRTLDGKEIKSGTEVRLARRPNMKQSGKQFMFAVMNRILTDGHVFIERVDQQGMKPKSLRVWGLRDLKPDIQRDPKTGEDFAWRWLRRTNDEPLIPGDEIVEWKLDNPFGNVYGLSPLSPGWLAVYSDIATGVYNRSFFENGANPGIVFSTDDDRFTQDQAEEAQRRWSLKRGGAKRAHQPAFMGNGLRPFPVSSTHKDMEFPTLKNLSRAEILAIYNVPESLLGAQAPSSGVSIGGGSRDKDTENFWLNTVMPWAEMAAEFWNIAVDERFGVFRAKFDFSNVPILQDRQLDRAKEAREWVNTGVPVNEVNRVFDLGFDEQIHGDEYWVSDNMVPARLLLDGPLDDAEAAKRGVEMRRKQDAEIEAELRVA